MSPQKVDIVLAFRLGLRAHAHFIALAASIAVLSACASQATTPPATSSPAQLGAVQPSAQKQYDVIIVGAGLAGLTAARTLKHAGISFVVLEATQRIGGRGFTDPQSHIDLGGAWIHGIKTNPLTPIVKGMGYATQETGVDAARHLFFSSRFATENERKKFNDAYAAFENDLEARVHPEEEGGEPKDFAASESLKAAAESLKAASKLERVSKGAAPGAPKLAPIKKGAAGLSAERGSQNLDSAFLALIDVNAGPLESATELTKNSSIDAAEFLAGPDELIVKGFGTFVQEYGKAVESQVRTGMPVTQISHGVGGVVVETANGERFNGRKVLVTVSTGVLRLPNPGEVKKTIKFDPPLPDWKRQAIDGLPMGLMNKVIVQFKKGTVFPEHDGQPMDNDWVLYGGDVDKTDDDMAFVFRPLHTDIVIGFFGGEQARKLEAEPDQGRDKMIKRATAAMKQMCKTAKKPDEKCDYDSAIERATITAWGSQDWTYGAYSAAAPGKAAMREKLAEPVDFRVYFAGEACSNPSYNGSFAGAYNSGLRASYALIECLNHEPCVWQPFHAKPESDSPWP